MSKKILAFTLALLFLLSGTTSVFANNSIIISDDNKVYSNRDNVENNNKENNSIKSAEEENNKYVNKLNRNILVQGDEGFMLKSSTNSTSTVGGVIVE